MTTKGYYCTQKRIDEFIANQSKDFEPTLLKKLVKSTYNDLIEYPIENKNQIRFYKKVAKTLKVKL